MGTNTRLLTSNDWNGAYNYIFNETNLYRSMLGLSTLDFNPYLDNSSTNISKYYVSTALDLNRYSIYWFNNKEKELEDNFPNENHYGMGRNVYCSRNVNANFGIEAFNTWQLSEDGNQILKYRDFDHIGIGYEDYTENNKTGVIYVTQQFVRKSCNKEIKQNIDFTPEMCVHLNDYSNLVLYNLNKLVDENIEYVNDWSSYLIQVDPLLNKIATYQLFLTIDDRLSEERIDDCVRNILHVNSFNEHMIAPITYLLPTYISPARLVHSKEGLSENIKYNIKNGDYNRFGINIALFDNKTFLVSIIFA